MPTFYSEMKSWPRLTAISKVVTAGTRRFKSILPFQADTPGIRTIFDENWMRENQVTQLPGYEVKKHTEQLPDWAKNTYATSKLKP